MLSRRMVIGVIFASAAALVWLGRAEPARAQQPQPNPGRIDNIGAGVVVDADGVLQTKYFRDRRWQLTRLRRNQALAALAPELQRPSKLRKVSLTRLEAALGNRLATGAGITEDMKYLAGLTRLRYVFFYPDTGDVVIAGPAEGYMLDPSGRAVGVTTGRSVLELQDLVAALRTFGPDRQRRGEVIGCSIDPTKQGLAQMQQFLMRIGRQATPRDTQFIVQGLGKSLGLQTVKIYGVSPKTHFAQVMVEADYRMKLIGIGLEIPPVKITSYVARANPASVARNALQRWYFIPNYECVRVAEDELAMELVGDGVKLVGQDEMVTAGGGRVKSAHVDRASQSFVTTFTRLYPELADLSPVYAQLRNLIDMTIAAAFIRQQDYYARADWKLAVFGDEKTYSIQTYHAPLRVNSAVNAIWKGHTLMTPIGGGVHIEPREALATDRLLIDEGGKVQAIRKEITVKGLAKGQWWWD